MIENKGKEFKSRKKKLGTLKIKSQWMGVLNKPIWVYLESNMWTQYKHQIVLNINFYDNEQNLMYMLKNSLCKNKKFKESDIICKHTHYQTHFKDYLGNNIGSGKLINYHKMFININTNVIALTDFIELINHNLSRCITTYKMDYNQELIDEFELDIIADLI